ncbi:MAG TPA: sulfatase [Candidatus Sulfotelmatobacter sp.]|nr:sulfatase [Candidatus Sulfotelmatobacter sp.]
MQKSIVLITVDCLRADHVGFMGYERPTTPFLDSLAAEAFVFPAAIVAGAPTYYSFPTIMASRYPLALGRDVLGLAPGEPSLAAVLKAAGYATASFSAANPYISGQFGYEQGFEVFRNFLNSDVGAIAESTVMPNNGTAWASRFNRKLQELRPRMGPLAAVYNGLYFEYCQRLATPAPDSLDALRRFPAADVIVDNSLSWLKSIKQGPFFLWLHLMDPHAPYYPNQKALEQMGSPTVSPFRARYWNSYWNRSDLGPKGLARHRDHIISLYDAGIRWVDEQTARLVAALKDSNRWVDCIFALTADHGEEFLDHRGRFHPPSRLTEELIHVPLLLRVAGAEKKELPESPFSMLHLAPTLLEAAGVPTPPQFRGHSFWSQVQKGSIPDETAISECVDGCTNPFGSENRLGSRVLAVREARYKLVWQFDPPAEYLYDLEADPGERRPLSATTDRPTRRRLLDRAREHIQRSIQDRDVESRLQARLRELRLEWASAASETE